MKLMFTTNATKYYSHQDTYTWKHMAPHCAQALVVTREAGRVSLTLFPRRIRHRRRSVRRCWKTTPTWTHLLHFLPTGL